jgi:hypothetical protein
MLVLASLLTIGCDQAPGTPTEVPQPTRANDAVYTAPVGLVDVDLGVLGDSSPPKCIYQLKNLTEHELFITETSKSCSCHVLSVQPGDSVLPGQTLPMTFELAGSSGQLDGSFTIRTTGIEPELSVIRFRLRASCPRRLWSEPSSCRIPGRAGESASGKFTLRSDVPDFFRGDITVASIRGLLSFAVVEQLSDRVIVEARSMQEPEAGIYRDLIRCSAPGGHCLIPVTLEIQ